MPIDPSIALQYKPIQLPDPMARAARMLAMQQGASQNMLAQLQLGKAQRDALLQEQYRADVSRLGPNASHEALLGAALPYVGPKEAATLMQSEAMRKLQLQQQRETSTAQIVERRARAEELHERELRSIDFKYDSLGQRTSDAEQRRALEAQRIEDKRLSDARHDETLRSIAGGNVQLRREIAAQGNKPPPGYRWAPEGNLERIPGGPADEKVGVAGEKARARAEGALSRAKIVINKVDEALKQTGFFTTGLIGDIRSTLPGRVTGSSAYDLEQTIDTIKANIGFKELQDMRESSPSGGALGQIAVRELDFLQAAVAALNKGQSEPQLRSNLKAVKTHFENWKKTVSGGAPNLPVSAPGGPQPGTGIKFLGFEQP